MAQEAVLTAEMAGCQTELIVDVGVAGLHRILAHEDFLRTCHVLVVVAGMEGALPSVVAGRVSVPVIAVPTSVGYGASFDGLAALLGMLNSCAPGISVVNIDNFGMKPKSWLIAIMRRGDGWPEAAPKDSSIGSPRVMPAARRKVLRSVFMIIFLQKAGFARWRE